MKPWKVRRKVSPKGALFDKKQALFTLALALIPLLHWTEPALPQACPVPSAVIVVPPLGPITAPPPMPSSSADCTPVPPVVVNGVCGAVSGTCSAGSPTAVNASGAWTCVGSNGGTTATCSPPPPPPPTITMGETSCALPGTDSGNAGLLLRQAATLAQAGTLQSLSFCVTTPAGQMRLGFYDNAGNIIVQTQAFTPVAGLNTVPVGQVPIPAGSYFLAHEPSNGGVAYPVDQASGSCQWANMPTFGAMPATFPSIAGSNPCHWGLSATLSVP